jgi:hypothetical protein
MVECLTVLFQIILIVYMRQTMDLLLYSLVRWTMINNGTLESYISTIVLFEPMVHSPLFCV